MSGQNTFYAKRKLWLGDGREGSIMMHRFITGWSRVNHINRDGLDNRRQNLRQATSRQSAQHRQARSTSQSGYKGICWYPRQQGWRVDISVEGGGSYLGSFEVLV